MRIKEALEIYNYQKNILLMEHLMLHRNFLITSHNYSKNIVCKIKKVISNSFKFNKKHFLCNYYL